MGPVSDYDRGYADAVRRVLDLVAEAKSKYQNRGMMGASAIAALDDLDESIEGIGSQSEGAGK
jgi:hypothetical protein